MGNAIVSDYEFLNYINIENSFIKYIDDIPVYYLYLKLNDLPTTQVDEPMLDSLDHYMNCVDLYHYDREDYKSYEQSMDKVIENTISDGVILFVYDGYGLHFTDLKMTSIVKSYFDCDFEDVNEILKSITSKIVNVK